MDTKFLAILVCPLCKGDLVYHALEQELICYMHRIAYPIKNGIPIMLSEEARQLRDNEVKPSSTTLKSSELL
jgi:uncharacterized protein YbaR (Trm112 family)